MNTEKLKALAEAATPGQLDVKDGIYPSFKKIVGPAFSLEFCWFAHDISQEQSRQRIADAEYIAAANPAVVLELIRQNDDLQTRASGLAEEINQQALKMAAVERQRDELLAALELAKEMFIANDMVLPHTFEVIDAAIEKAKGGAA